jgi:hypothetical protein
MFFGLKNGSILIKETCKIGCKWLNLVKLKNI